MTATQVSEPEELRCDECGKRVPVGRPVTCEPCVNQACEDAQDLYEVESEKHRESPGSMIRDWLDRRKMNPSSPTREQVEFVELLIDDLGAR